MIIQPLFTGLLFYIIVLYIGVDFIITGILFQKEYDEQSKRPKTMGMLVLKLNQTFFDRMRKQNQIYQFIYSFKGIKFLTILAGILLGVGSAIQIIGILAQLTLQK